jgi:prepilin-type N-terminal cleavage/methylation domain-containing protein
LETKEDKVKNLKFVSNILKSLKDLVGFAKKLSLNNNGFSMMEVMIASGLMGIAALGMMQLQKSSSEGQIRTKNSMEIYSLQQTLKQQFLNQNTCMGTLRQQTFDAGVVTGTHGYADQLADPDQEPPTSVKPLATVTMQRYKKLDGEEDFSTVLTTLNQKYNGDRIILKNIEIFDIAPMGTASTELAKHEVTLRFGYLRKKKMQDDPTEGAMIFSFIKLEVMVALVDQPKGFDYTWATANTVVKCFSAEGNAVITSLRESCVRVDIDQNGVPDNIFDEDSLKCSPQPTEGLCVYGGTYSTGTSTYNNPLTGLNGCSPGYTAVITGHFTHATPKPCGKLQCYEFNNQPSYTCLKCTHDTNSVVHTNVLGGTLNGAANNAAAACAPWSCPPKLYPDDLSGDGCDDTCVDPSGYIP